MQNSVIIFLKINKVRLSGFGCCCGYLAVRAVLLSSHVEVVEDAALGGDALGVGRLVPEPGEGCLAVITDLRHNISDTQLSLLNTYFLPGGVLGETLQFYQDRGGNLQAEVPILRQGSDIAQVVHKDVGVGHDNFRSTQFLKIKT